MLTGLWPPQGAAWIAWLWGAWALRGLLWWAWGRRQPGRLGWAMACFGSPCLAYLLALGLVCWDPTWEDNGVVEAVGWPERWAFAFLLALPIWVLGMPLTTFAWLRFRRLLPGFSAPGDRPPTPPAGHLEGPP